MSVDPVQLLDRLRPPSGWSEPVDLAGDPIAAQILERVFADTGNVISFDAARRRRRGIAAAVGVAAIITGGAVAAIWDRSPQEARRVACWSEATDPPAEQLLVSWDGVSDPAVLCAAEWSSGHFGEPATPPELRVCVTADNVAAAIPGGDDVCDVLGLADFVPSLDDPAARLVQAQAELDRRFNGVACVGPDQAAAAVPAVLDTYGLAGWGTKIAGAFSADEPCATVALDPETSTAFVRPVPRQG